MAEEKLSTAHKASQINRDATKYGTFAEIGAGQEVVRWFFHVGGASGTVAKTISAYDMAVSDAIYGPADRYVSRQRLQAMLDYEFNLLLQRLDKSRGDRTHFFAFADTVATHQQNGRGWLGMKFQTAPHETPSAIIIHVRMLDPDIARQQEAMGIVGVNLVHGAFYGHGEPEQLIASLLDNLNRQRIEVDMVKFAGPRFEGVDNRLMSLQLVQQHLSDAAMFTAEGEVVIPSEVLYKKPVLVERGSFRPITATTLDILERALEQFLREPQVNGEEPVILMEMTLHSVLEDATQGHKDFLDRVDLLRALGRTVVISDFGRYYRLVEYLSRYTQKMQGIAMGVPSLRGIFDEKFYADLPGGLLEGLGRLFKGATKLYVYPFRDPAAGPSGGIVTADSLEVAPHLRHLYAHLLQNNHIAAIENYRPEYLSLFPPLILSKIQSGDESWERDVPPRIVELVKRERMFGWREKPAAVSA